MSEEQEEFDMNANKDKQEVLVKVPGSHLKAVARSKAGMKEFMVESCNLYCPSDRDLTAKFLQKVLSGEKDLLEMKDVNFLQEIPQLAEIKTKVLYDKVKEDEDINKFLPNYSAKKIPGRTYLCNIINTLHPNVFRKLVKALRKKKQVQRELNMKKYVLVKPKFAEKLKVFQSKRDLQLEKEGRFIGLLQEDRKKEVEVRKSYSKVEFDFDLEQIVKKVKK